MNNKILAIIIVFVAVIMIAGFFVWNGKYRAKTMLLPNNPDLYKLYKLQNQTASSTKNQNNNSQSATEIFEIIIKNFAFNPLEIAIKAGDKIKWTNQDTAKHDIIGKGFGDIKGFSSIFLGKGESFEYQFMIPGTYDYNCSLHPSMKGKIIVE